MRSDCLLHRFFQGLVCSTEQASSARAGDERGARKGDDGIKRRARAGSDGKDKKERGKSLCNLFPSNPITPFAPFS